MHCDDDEDERGKEDQDQQEVMVSNAARCEIALRFLGAGSELREFLIAEAGDGFVNFLRIHVRRLERLLRLTGGKEAVQFLQVLLSGLRGVNGGLLQVVGAHQVS